MNLTGGYASTLTAQSNREFDDTLLQAAIDDAVNDGDAMLKFQPLQLLRALCEVATDAEFDHAIRELLRPLYSETQGYIMKEFHESSKRHEAVREVARMALELDREHMRGF